MTTEHKSGDILLYWTLLCTGVSVLVLVTMYLSILTSCLIVLAQLGTAHVLLKHLFDPPYLFALYGKHLSFWWTNRYALNLVTHGFPLLVPPPVFLAVALWRANRFSDKLRAEIIPEPDPLKDIAQQLDHAD